MGTCKALLGVVFLFASLSLVAQSGSSADELKLVALEKMWNQAQLTSALRSMISDRFVNTEWDGVLSSRAEFLAEIADPKFVPAVMSVQELKVEFYGDTAVVVGVYHTKGQYNGKPYDHVGRFTDTWVRQGSFWKCVASHTSLIQK